LLSRSGNIEWLAAENQIIAGGRPGRSFFMTALS
jgi:hypothetical protein